MEAALKFINQPGILNLPDPNCSGCAGSGHYMKCYSFRFPTDIEREKMGLNIKLSNPRKSVKSQKRIVKYRY